MQRRVIFPGYNWEIVIFSILVKLNHDYAIILNLFVFYVVACKKVDRFAKKLFGKVLSITIPPRRDVIDNKQAQRWNNDHQLKNKQPENIVGTCFETTILLCPAVY
jgi:hypothetical protein